MVYYALDGGARAWATCLSRSNGKVFKIE